eukprot:TRINITY_DN1308_c2_g1_i5.p1 TRINITY_DN1308_c2_g1~~TRINITY_DN1308_c2_g1_i5.p1  ORF type:complete len:399 (-),score=113.41 TRINITY_DN1308_c2_g1_i5:84-1280(-)
MVPASVLMQQRTRSERCIGVAVPKDSDDESDEPCTEEELLARRCGVTLRLQDGRTLEVEDGVPVSSTVAMLRGIADARWPDECPFARTAFVVDDKLLLDPLSLNDYPFAKAGGSITINVKTTAEGTAAALPHFLPPLRGPHLQGHHRKHRYKSGASIGEPPGVPPTPLLPHEAGAESSPVLLAVSTLLGPNRDSCVSLIGVGDADRFASALDLNVPEDDDDDDAKSKSKKRLPPVQLRFESKVEEGREEGEGPRLVFPNLPQVTEEEDAGSAPSASNAGGADDARSTSIPQYAEEVSNTASTKAFASVTGSEDDLTLKAPPRDFLCPPSPEAFLSPTPATPSSHERALQQQQLTEKADAEAKEKQEHALQLQQQQQQQQARTAELVPVKPARGCCIVL